MRLDRWSVFSGTFLVAWAACRRVQVWMPRSRVAASVFPLKNSFTQSGLTCKNSGPGRPLHSKAVVTGDVTQIDLAHPEDSGLLSAEKILGYVKGLAFIRLTDKDVVRHRLVQDIIRAYDKSSESIKRAGDSG